VKNVSITASATIRRIPRDNIGFLPESTNFMLFQLIDLSMWGSMLPNNGTMMLRSNLSIPFTKSKKPL
jgi:hypothetical protein